MPKRLLRLLVGLAALAVMTVLSGKAFPSLSETPKRDEPHEQVATTTPGPLAVSSTTETVSSTVKTNALVTRVVDGDTIHVRIDGESADATIRLLGINTPETVDPRKAVECFGKEASKHMHELVEGKRVRLDEDVQADNLDKYQRLLRNVLLEDGTDVNASMVREGYAYAYLSFPLNPARKVELKKLENSARISGFGLWSTSTCNGLK